MASHGPPAIRKATSNGSEPKHGKLHDSSKGEGDWKQAPEHWRYRGQNVSDLSPDDIRTILEDGHLERGMALWLLHREPDCDEVRSNQPGHMKHFDTHVPP